MSFTSFQHLHSLIDLEVTSKLSKLKWKHKPLACRQVQVSLQKFEHFYVISMVEKNVDCWELFSIVFLIWRCQFYLGKSCSRDRQAQLLRHHVASKLLCYCEKTFPSHARKFKIVRRILFISTNCAVFVLFSFLLVTSFEQDSEPAVVAEKMTRLLSEAEPPMRTTQDQEVGLLFLSSFFSFTITQNVMLCICE